MSDIPKRLETARSALGELVDSDASNVEAARLAARTQASLNAGRRKFLFAGAELRASEDLALANKFKTPQQYYQFLARTGMSPTRRPYQNGDLTAKVANVAEQLHTPDTVAWVKTNTHLLGTDYAIGRVVGARAFVNSTPQSMDLPELSLAVQIGAVRGEPTEVGVAIDDIAAGFEYRINPEMSHPMVAIGNAAVQAEVDRIFFGPVNRGQREKSLTAMCASGLRLPELGFSQADVASKRTAVVQTLEDVRDRAGTYRSELLMLPALSVSNEAALATANEVLGDRRAYDLSPDLGRDYHTLLHHQEAAAPSTS